MKQAEWKKSISRDRDDMQSRVLVVVMLPLLAAGCVKATAATLHAESLRALLFPVLFSAGLALAAWKARSATLPAAGMGFLISLILTQAPMTNGGGAGFRALIALSVLSFGATRFGRAKKEARGLAEAKSGRKASQIVANTGVAALCAAMGLYAGCIAAMAEAAADTVSSETGQALGGKTWMITTLRRVPAGQDGGISAAGTAAGVAAGVLVVIFAAYGVTWQQKTLMFAAACAGLLFDSVLGATVEQKGWLGNDWVNFSSTIFAALAGWIVSRS